MPLHKDKEKHGQESDNHVNEPSRKKETQPISHVIDWFQQELVDIPIFNIARNLPVIFSYAG